jgi:hypothetical protein
MRPWALNSGPQLCQTGTLLLEPLPSPRRLFFIFWWDWSLNSGLHTSNTGALLLEPHLQSILLWLFLRWGLVSYLPELASNHDPPDFSLPSSWDYRREPLVPS